MSLRRTACAVSLVAGLAWRAAPVGADTFSGFSGVDRPYLVNQDRVCVPLAVADGAATGAPRCEKVSADVVARLSIKAPLIQSGAKAAFVAQAAGRTITVTRRSGATAVAWDAPDPVGKIVEVYASQFEDRVAVAYTARRLGKEVTDVVAFDLGPRGASTGQPGAQPPAGQAGDPPPTGQAGDPPPTGQAPTGQPGAQPPAVSDPRLAALVAAARGAAKPKARSAWAQVLAIDAGHAEALYRTAVADAAAKRSGDAIAGLAALARSSRGDAIEWLIEARFDPAFAALRADAAYRAAVGLDRRPTTPYERLLGFGGQWEQSGTSCDRPEVRFSALRDRTFKLRVKTTCEGHVYDSGFKGTWRLDGDRVVLQLPNKGKALSDEDEARCLFEGAGDEDAMRCVLGRDLDFVVLPARR